MFQGIQECTQTGIEVGPILHFTYLTGIDLLRVFKQWSLN
jgi:hypothetical protein